MPELPEVEIINRGLNRLIVGKVINSVLHDNAKSFPNAPADVDQFLVGAKITGVSRRAKVLMIELSSGYSLLIHLKMTGQLVYVARRELSVISDQLSEETDNALLTTDDHRSSSELRFGAGHPTKSLAGNLPDKSTRVIFELAEEPTRGLHLDDGQERNEQRSEVYGQYTQRVAEFLTRPGAKSTGGLDGSAGKQDSAVQTSWLFFNDQRKFGWVKLFPTVEVPNIDFMKRVGPEPLEDSFAAKDFIQRLRRRNRTTIKAALLDQTTVAGIGNIYADESLWGAKIHPAARVMYVSDASLRKLLAEVRSVLLLSIEKGGSTDRNYVDADGKKGSYLGFANVFRREGQPCNRCQDIIIKSRVAGRGTHTCPTCQPSPEITR